VAGPARRPDNADSGWSGLLRQTHRAKGGPLTGGRSWRLRFGIRMMPTPGALRARRVAALTVKQGVFP